MTRVSKTGTKVSKHIRGIVERWIEMGNGVSLTDAVRKAVGTDHDRRQISDLCEHHPEIFEEIGVEISKRVRVHLYQCNDGGLDLPKLRVRKCRCTRWPGYEKDTAPPRWHIDVKYVDVLVGVELKSGMQYLDINAVPQGIRNDLATYTPGQVHATDSTSLYWQMYREAVEIGSPTRTKWLEQIAKWTEETRVETELEWLEGELRKQGLYDGHAYMFEGGPFFKKKKPGETTATL